MYRTLFLLVLLSGVAMAKPPREQKTQVMYFTTKLEVQLSKLYKEARMAFPVMRLGIMESIKPAPPNRLPLLLEKDRPRPPVGKRFAFIRILVHEGAGRSAVAREVLDCARIAFKLVPYLEQADIDAVLHDDTSKSKAEPWFAVSLKASDLEGYSLKSVPEQWLTKKLQALTISPKLKPDRDPVQVTCDTFYSFYNDAYLRVPITRAPPKGKTRKTTPGSGKTPGEPDLPAQPY